MNEPATPAPPSHEEENRDLQSQSSSAPAAQKTWEEWIFQGPHGVRLGWRLLVYLGCGGAVVYLLLWLGKSFFADYPHGVSALWLQLYGETAFLLGAVLPAFLMAYIEGRPFDDYGLPRSAAFGRLFWVGAVWGLTAITVLLLVMRGVHVFYFGHLVLHGVRILKFAAFWGGFFVAVALFEEFLLRGYLLFTLSSFIGFWPAALLLSSVFGAIHLRNPGEGVVGALGAAVIGFFFCLTLRRTGNLWFAVGFHAAWDWGETFLWGVPDSGTTAPGHMFGPYVVDHPTWLTGGSVGPEGSLLCFVLIALLWGLFHRAYPQAKYKSAVATELEIPTPHHV